MSADRYRAFCTAGLIIVGLLSAVLVTACGSSSGQSGGGTDGDVKPSIAVVSISGSDRFATYDRGFERAGEELGLDVEIHHAPNLESNVIANTINAAIASNPDYLIASAIDSAALRQPLLTASQRGIKVITYDTQVEDPSFVTAYVNASYQKWGEVLGTEMAKVVGSEGGSILLDEIVPGNQPLEELTSGFEASLPENITTLPVVYSMAENSKLNQIVRSTLSREPNLAGLVAAFGFGAEGGVSALSEAGKIGDVKVVGEVANDYGLESLRKGETDVIVAAQDENLGAAAVEAAYDDANGEKVSEEILVPLCVITAETIDAPKNRPCIP